MTLLLVVKCIEIRKVDTKTVDPVTVRSGMCTPPLQGAPGRTRDHGVP